MKTILLVLFMSVMAYGQNHITLNVSQDAKLLVAGDDKGNDPLTMDIAIRSEWQLSQMGYGYFFIAPEYEYAELREVYRRYSVNVGYTINQLVIDRLEATVSVGHGILDHYQGFMSFGANLQLSYPIWKDVKFFVDCELIERKDLTLWDSGLSFTETIRVSGKFGFKINLK